MTVIHSRAVVITTPPSFSPSSAAPLAGTLQVITDVPTRISIIVNDGGEGWERNFLDYTTNHTITLLGFKPNLTNKITVVAWDRYRNSTVTPEPLVFITDPLPASFPTIVLRTNQPAKMEPGFTLFRGLNNGYRPYVIIVDNSGEIVWYSSTTTVLDVRQLPNGDLFIPLSTGFNEVNMLGQIVKKWVAPSAWKVNNHDGVPTDHGTILYLSDTSQIVTNFPTSAINSNAPTATTNVMHQTVVEIATSNSALLNVWYPIKMLDQRRISYLTFSIKTAQGWDWGHANAVIEDPRDDSLIVSLRHQNAVIKFSRANGQLKWILGPHENWGPAFQPFLLTPVGTIFTWNYAQHAPKITPQGTLLLYDNGNYQANPFDSWVSDPNNFSRAVEYRIDEKTMQVSQVWCYASTDETLYTGSVGDADYLPQTGNVLVTFGNVSYVNGKHPSPYSSTAAMVRIKEVTHETVPEVVFDLELFDETNTNSDYGGCFAYRSDRIPDLYSVLPQPVSDLALAFRNARPVLQFSGNPLHTYVVEASTNLSNWETIGVAEASGGAEYDFWDEQANALPARYYRIITQ